MWIYTPKPSEDPAQQALEQEISQYINKTVKITIVDGRVYTGTFYCYDSRGNILLNRSHRVLAPDSTGIETTKFSGLCMIPIDTLVDIQVSIS